jgi:hypothetical protein
MLFGGLLGVFWMVDTMPSSASAATCEGKKVDIAQCIADTLGELLMVALAKVGVGVFGGAFLAIVLIGVTPGLRRSSRA